MSVVPLKPEDNRVELIGDRLHIQELSLEGTIVDVIREGGGADSPEQAERIFCDVVDVGASLMRHGQTQALISSVKSEVERLLTVTSSTTEQLPTTVRDELTRHLTKLTEVLGEHFDPKRTKSVQNQLATMVNGATAEQGRKLLNELLGERGPITALNERVIDQLRVVSGSSHDLVEKVTALAEKIEAKLNLEEAHEHSTQKGASFEEVLHEELDAIFGPLGDEVRCVKKEYGSVQNSQAGDFIVILNPRETGGREMRIVVEAKTGKLTSPKARQAIEDAIKNRDAAAAVLVFDGVGDAPLGGRYYGQYGPEKLVAVLDVVDMDTLALEVACRHARALAISSRAEEAGVDAAWLLGRCQELSKLIENGREIRNGANAARRGLDKVDAAYAQLRSEALAVIDEIESKLDSSDPGE